MKKLFSGNPECLATIAITLAAFAAFSLIDSWKIFAGVGLIAIVSALGSIACAIDERPFNDPRDS